VNTDTVAEPLPITLLPLDKRHRRIPWFVHREPDGEPDFRIAVAGKLRQAVAEHRCWICGELLAHPDGDAYVIGPMCTVNRISTEPPNHRACAIYAVQACPFLTHPHMRRRDTGIPQDRLTSENGFTHNPGVTAIWCTPHATLIREPNGYPVFQLDAPTRVWWWKQGRRATRSEVTAALEFCHPIMEEHARAEGDHALAELENRYTEALKLLPPHAT
jgi:hypothetical protein